MRRVRTRAGDPVEGTGKRQEWRKKKKKFPAGRKVMGHAGRRHESRRFNDRSSIPADWLSPAGRARTGAAAGIKTSAAPRAGEKRPHSVSPRGRGWGRGGEEREAGRRPPASHTPPRVGVGVGGHSVDPFPSQSRRGSHRTNPPAPPPLQDEAAKVGALHAGGTFWVQPPVPTFPAMSPSKLFLEKSLDSSK